MAVTPQEILTAYHARLNETNIVDAYQQRRETLRDWYDRIRIYDEFQRGIWPVTLPDGTRKNLQPVIENRVRGGVEDQGRLAADSPPTIRCEAANEKGFARAQTREQIIQYYHQLSRTWSWLSLVYMDQIGTGLGAIQCLPDFRKPREERFPIFSRVDPRTIVPPANYRAGDPVEDLIVANTRKLRDVKRRYPEAAIQLASVKKHGQKPITDTSDVDLFWYYAPDEIQLVACLAGGDSPAVRLYAVENEAGMIPVALIPRISADGRLRGQFDDVLNPLVQENRLAQYLADYVHQGVYAPLIKTGMPGQSIDFGPDSVIDLPENASLGRLGPAQVSPDVWRFMADMERQSRRGGVMPEARAGDVQQSIVSGAGLEAMQGQLVTNIRSLQQQMEAGLQYLNEVAQNQDRVWCDAQKSIVGYAQGGQFRLTYTPTLAIREGDTSNVVTYGAGAGLDEFNKELVIHRRQQAGWVSSRWARENVSGIESVLKEEKRIMEEQLLNATFTGILAQANAGNLAPVAAFKHAMEKNENPLELIDELVAASQSAAPAPQAGPLGQGPAPGEAAQPTALPREAIEGQREQALPPLQSILLGG